MKPCLMCGADIAGPGLFRIKIGGVTYDNEGDAHFIRQEVDHFPDHTTEKWLCGQCAEKIELYIDELDFDVCRAPEGESICGRTFEPIEEDDSESVICIEWGKLIEIMTEHGPEEEFQPSEGGHLHYWCCAEGFELPFHTIPYTDEPVFS